MREQGEERGRKAGYLKPALIDFDGEGTCVCEMMGRKGTPSSAWDFHWL